MVATRDNFPVPLPALSTVPRPAKLMTFSTSSESKFKHLHGGMLV